MAKTFARSFRLTKTDEFSSVFGFRRAIRGKVLMLHYQPRAEGQHGARLGLVVGKKQLKRAVDRNRLKRIVREAFRLQRDVLPSCDVIVRLSVKLSDVSPATLQSDLTGFWQRLTRRLNEPVSQ